MRIRALLLSVLSILIAVAPVQATACEMHCAAGMAGMQHQQEMQHAVTGAAAMQGNCPMNMRATGMSTASTSEGSRLDRAGNICHHDRDASMRDACPGQPETTAAVSHATAFIDAAMPVLVTTAVLPPPGLRTRERARPTIVPDFSATSLSISFRV